MGTTNYARQIRRALLPAAVVLLGLSGGEVFASGDQPIPLRRAADGSNLIPIRSGSGDGLQVERLERKWESIVRVREELGPHPMSRKGMARRDARVRGLFRREAPEPDTLRVLLIRIAFEEDRSGPLTSITEDGNFQLEPDPDILFDPPPRDRRFFEAHAAGLAEYWSSMSNGQIVAETTVLPPGDQDAYFLSDIADYGPGSGGFWTIPRLEKLVQDMIAAADQGTLADGSANLADYDFNNPDTHIVFAHAGADLQSNLVWEPGQPGYSPNDIPTFFVTLGDSAVVDLESVDSKTGEPGIVSECSVIPETISQDGLVGAISAALMHEFGHALGLPDLYSTTTGFPTIGYWGIMDSGTNLAAVVGVPDPDNPDEIVAEFVTGLLPPQPTIWSKWYLGLVDEKRVGANEQTFDLPASYRQDTREKALRIDVSPDEFFLVENRWVPPVIEPSWGLASDPESGVVLFLGEYEEVAPGEFRLIGNTHLYDFFMPWSGGVLIWRVRQDRVEEGMAFNTVQVSPTRLGVELVEADGIKDIGIADFATRGFLGSDTDAFRSASSFAYDGGTVNIPGTSTEFGPDTLPPSRSSFRIPTGVNVSGIGPTTDSSTPVTTSIDGLMGAPDLSYPVEVPGAMGADGTLVVSRGDAMSLSTVDVAGRTAVLASAGQVDRSEAPGLYAFDRDGAPFLANPRIADLPGPVVGGPVLLDLPSARWLVTVSDDGQALSFDVDAGFTPLPLVQATLDSVDTQPLLFESADSNPWVVAANLARSSVHSVVLHPDSTVVDFDLPEGARLQAPPVIARISGEDVVAVLYDGVVDVRRPDGSPIDASVWPIELPEAAAPDSMGWIVAWPDPDGDQMADDRIAVANERGQVSRVSAVDGARLVGDATGAAPVDELVLADVDGDGVLDLLVTTQDRVWALNDGGSPLRGWPVALSELLILVEREVDRFVRSPVVADLDGDGLNEVALTTHYGITHVLSDRGQSEDGFPRAFSASGSTLGVVDFAGGTPTRALVSFDALGDTLGSLRRARAARFNALDLGPAPEVGPDERPAEWTLRGGSMQREGRGTDGGAAAANASDPAEGLDTALMIPNPIGNADDQAFVRYYSGAAHTATITVYTLEGEEAGRWTHEVPDAGRPVQLAWSPRGLSSGPYLCRVDYVGRDGRTTDLKTVYVER